MKVLSFSLFGQNPLYNIGIIKNAILHKKIYFDWEMRVYYNSSVPNDTINELKKYDVKLIKIDENYGFFNCFWRFFPISENNVKYFISRDADSRISYRDFEATSEWIESGKDFHIIRDHPTGHHWPIQAGMWGSKGGMLPNFFKIMSDYRTQKLAYHNKMIDQEFLKEIIYPLAIKSLFLHDEYFNYEKIGVKIKRDRKIDNFSFIGEVIDENDLQVGDEREIIKKIYWGNK